MKIIITFAMILIASMIANGQSIYERSFGNSNDKPIIFLHGGPGYNCANFEVTTAKQLSDKGFFVIVYDRRGEGRSIDSNAKFTFNETFEDLEAIFQKYGFSKATLIGHSFGGIIATLFAEKYPEKVQSIILTGAPISLQETFSTILASSKIIYQEKDDVANLNYLTMLENMDKSSIQFSSYCFMHAMQNGFYSPKNPSDEAKFIYSKFKSDTTLTKYASKMTIQAPQGFWRNEKYTTLDLTSNIKQLLAKNINFIGLYGKDDGLFSAAQIEKLQDLIGKINVKYYDNCSHNVFIDQQSQFIEDIVFWSN